ncbi:agarase [Amycolatopsis sp. CA-161197]|uniref:agarase n=1 Tax=Amycolatopsis sp. CA-161197 TaxID=3239922 RepID=UPI003D8FF0E2
MTASTPPGATADVKAKATGFFRAQQVGDRWWLITPGGHGFISVGLNHLEETDLQYPHNAEVYRERYGTREKWLAEAALPDLREWGFNTLGWTQQWVTGRAEGRVDWDVPIDLGHSLGWSGGEVRGAGMPYVQQLRVAPIEDWNGNPVFPDVFSDKFAEHCDYLARQYCFGAAQDPNLIGYFLTDIPAWLRHSTGKHFGELDDVPGSAAHEDLLYKIADQYYKTVVEAIRRYDPNHLVLGDRYNGNKGIPPAVLHAAADHVDVLSIQYFCGTDQASFDQMRDDLAAWSAQAGKPVLIADIGNMAPTDLNPHRYNGLADQRARGENYVDSLATVLGEPWFVGWHWCGYLENLSRGWGLKSPYDEPYEDMTTRVAEFNHGIYTRIGG